MAVANKDDPINRFNPHGNSVIVWKLLDRIEQIEESLAVMSETLARMVDRIDEKNDRIKELQEITFGDIKDR